MDLGVRDKVYALVGGVGGMGLEAAKVLAAEGAKVALIGRTRARGEPRAQAIAEATGAQVIMVQADGTEPGQLDAAIAEVIERLGRLDGLAVTAGTLQTRKVLTELADEDWDQYFQVHLMTTVRACRAAIPHLIAAGGGTIVNTAAYSIRAQKPALLGYATMKAAVASLTKNIALTYGPQGVRANTICPGFVATESTHGLMRMAAERYDLPPMQALNRLMVEDYRMSVALGRAGLPEELGELFAFLLSARAGYLTGATINCDGGTQF
jgi:3-oxoacyl-[acyl-carrier protein] reductase